MTLYKIIDKQLNKRHKTDYWLSKKAGVSVSLLYKMRKKSDYTITLNTAIKIADALEISLDEFRR